MKRFLAMFLLAVMLVCLAGCASWLPYETTVSHKYYEDATLRVNPITKTIQHGDDTYTYQVNGNTVRIQYPNQCVYEVNLENGHGKFKGNVITNDDLTHEMLFCALTEDALAAKNTAMLLVGIVFGGFGLWHLLLPKHSLIAKAFGWGFWQSGESSGAKLGIRLAGGGLILLGTIFILLA